MLVSKMGLVYESLEDYIFNSIVEHKTESRSAALINSITLMCVISFFKPHSFNACLHFDLQPTEITLYSTFKEISEQN